MYINSHNIWFWRCIAILIKNNPHGGDIYTNKVKNDFSANVSPLGTVPEIIQAIKESAEDILSYPDAYCAELRAEISKKYSEVKLDNIICGNGAADLIFGFALATKPKKALIVSPTFCEYEIALKTVDCHINYYELKKENGFNLETELISSISAEYDALFICNPNNPTGKFYDISLIEKIVNHCKTTNTTVFIDECFFDLTGQSYDKSAVTLLKNKNLVVLKAFTKSYGIAGVRLGYLLTHNSDVIGKMSHSMQCWNVSTIAQAAGVAALKYGDEHIKKSVNLIQIERRFLCSELDKLNIKYIKSDCNFILFQSTASLFESMLNKGILIRSCSNFFGLDESYYRIAIKSNGENKAFIKALREIYENG